MYLPGFKSELVNLITRYGLDQKHPAQTVTKTDWYQVKLMAERGMVSDNMCKSLVFMAKQDIEYFIDYPDHLHRIPAPDQFYAEGRPDIRLGEVKNAPELEFGIHLDQPLFCLVSNLIGYGKTTAIRVMLKGINEYNDKNPDQKISVIVFDRKGGDYADLPARFGWKHYHVYNSLRLSLENPVGMPPRAWLNILTNNFCDRAGLGYSEVSMANAMWALLGLLNPKPQKRLIWPDFQLLLDFLKALPADFFSSKREYTRSLIQQLEGICQSSFKTFNAFQGFRAEELIAKGQSAVIAMPNMQPSWIRQLFVDIIVSRVMKGRIERSQKTEKVQVLFVVDEARPDVHARSELRFSDYTSPLSECFKLGREFGIGAVLSVSSLVDISELIKQNATTHMMFRVKDPVAADHSARTLMLPPNGELTFSHLAKGECLVSQAGPWPHALKVKIDYMPPSRTKNIQYDTHRFIPSKRLAEMPYLQRAVSKLLGSYNKNKKPAGRQKQDRLSANAKELVKTSVKYPFIPVARLFEKIGVLSFSRQNSIRKELEEKQLALFEEIRIGKPNVLLIEPTSKTYHLLGLTPPAGNKGRGNLTHRTFAHWIKIHLERQGFQCTIEGKIPGTNHPGDVTLSSENKLLVFEICISSSDNMLSHIKACFEETSFVEKMIIVTATKVKLKKIKKQIYSSIGLKPYFKKVKFETIQKYIPAKV